MIHRDILKAPLSPARRDELGRRFSELVFEKVLACPFVPGAREFLEAHHRATPLYVISGTPDAELSTIIARRRLSGYFRGAYGSDRQKDELLRGIFADLACRARDIVFVGDAPTDYQAAEKTGVPFIGRVPEGRQSPFPKLTPVVSDLRGLKTALTGLAAAPT
jgi:phosphoglycolate phosphatase-like HAD superfamily hydrolase